MEIKIRHRKSCQLSTGHESGQVTNVIPFPQAEPHEHVVLASLALGYSLENAAVDPEYLRAIMWEVLTHVLREAPGNCPSQDFVRATEVLQAKVCIFAQGTYQSMRGLIPADEHEAMLSRIRARVTDELFLIGVVHAVAIEVLRIGDG